MSASVSLGEISKIRRLKYQVVKENIFGMAAVYRDKEKELIADLIALEFNEPEVNPQDLIGNSVTLRVYIELTNHTFNVNLITALTLFAQRALEIVKQSQR